MSTVHSAEWFGKNHRSCKDPNLRIILMLCLVRVMILEGINEKKLYYGQLIKNFIPSSIPFFL